MTKCYRYGNVQSDMTRSIPPWLATIVECLELDQPVIVTLAGLARIADEAGIRTPARVVAHRLRERGWLLPTGLSGAWEFAPAAHAGPIGRGGPLIPIRAALALEPDLPVALALGSAVWAHGLADRAPERAEVAVAPHASVPVGLRRGARVVRYAAGLGPQRLKQVPTHRLETVLVHLATKPVHVTSWGAVAEWLPDAAAEADEAKVWRELAGRATAARTRLAYLLQGVWPDLAEQLRQDPAAKVWMGPRGTLRRHSEHWRVADTILPFDPAKLPRAHGR